MSRKPPRRGLRIPATSRWPNSRLASARASRTNEVLALLQEHVFSRIGHAAARALPVAGILQPPADGVDPLHRANVREFAAAAGVGCDFELQPGDVVGACARGIGDSLAGDAAAVIKLPGGTCAVMANHLAIERQRRLRRGEGPHELAVRA